MIEQIKRRSVKKALSKIEKLKAKYMAEGLSKKEASDKAYKEARDNPRRNFRTYKKKQR
jgi:uncharacterized protein YoaH (UPF0181 family)